MALSTYFSHDPIFSLAEFPSVLDEFLNTGGSRLPRRGQGENNQSSGLWRPKMDLHDDSQTNLVTATFELPGLAKENLQIDVDVINHRLTISGEHDTSEKREDKEKRFTVRERWHGKFSRSLPLPHGVKPEEVKASLKDGVLAVTFPKTTPEQAPARIAID